MRADNLSTNYFDQIYQAALKQDPTLLPKNKYCIDEFKQGTYGISAAAQLASEGKKEAVKWLMQRGANINWVAFGAAMGGNKDWVKELMDQGAHIQWVACGAALGGHHDWVIELIKQIDNLNIVARNAAMGGHKKLAMELVDKGAEINVVAYGAGMLGDENWINDLIEKKSAPSNRVPLGAAHGGHRQLALKHIKKSRQTLLAACHATMGGHRNLALELIKKNDNSIMVADDAAEGGHRDLVFELLKKNDDIDEIAGKAALAGHGELALEFINIGADCTYAASYAAEGKHWALALELIDQGADISEVAYHAAEAWEWKFVAKLIEKGADISRVADGASIKYTMSDQDHQLWILSHFINAQQQPQFIEALKNLDKPVHIKPDIAKRANRIERLMYIYGYSYSFALMSTRVTETTRHHGALTTLASLVGCQQGELQQFPFAYEMWLKIFEFVFDSKVSSEQFDQLGFLTIRLLLIHQLEHCESETKDQLILLALSKNNINELAQWVSEQHKTLVSKDKGKEKTNDIKTPSTLPEIFSLWHQRLGSRANTEEGASNQALKDFKSANAAA